MAFRGRSDGRRLALYICTERLDYLGGGDLLVGPVAALVPTARAVVLESGIPGGQVLATVADLFEAPADPVEMMLDGLLVLHEIKQGRGQMLVGHGVSLHCRICLALDPLDHRLPGRSALGGQLADHLLDGADVGGHPAEGVALLTGEPESGQRSGRAAPDRRPDQLADTDLGPPGDDLGGADQPRSTGGRSRA